jgi:hypothetical protein
VQVVSTKSRNQRNQYAPNQQINSGDFVKIKGQEKAVTLCLVEIGGIKIHRRPSFYKPNESICNGKKQLNTDGYYGNPRQKTFFLFWNNKAQEETK